MAIHELALLVTFYDVRVDTVFKVKVDEAKTEVRCSKSREATS